MDSCKHKFGLDSNLVQIYLYPITKQQGPH